MSDLALKKRRATAQPRVSNQPLIQHIIDTSDKMSTGTSRVLFSILEIVLFTMMAAPFILMAITAFPVLLDLLDSLFFWACVVQYLIGRFATDIFGNTAYQVGISLMAESLLTCVAEDFKSCPFGAGLHSIEAVSKLSTVSPTSSETGRTHVIKPRRVPMPPRRARKLFRSIHHNFKKAAPQAVAPQAATHPTPNESPQAPTLPSPSCQSSEASQTPQTSTELILHPSVTIYNSEPVNCDVDARASQALNRAVGYTHALFDELELLAGDPRNDRAVKWLGQSVCSFVADVVDDIDGSEVSAEGEGRIFAEVVDGEDGEDTYVEFYDGEAAGSWFDAAADARSANEYGDFREEKPETLERDPNTANYNGGRNSLAEQLESLDSDVDRFCEGYDSTSSDSVTEYILKEYEDDEDEVTDDQHDHQNANERPHPATQPHEADAESDSGDDGSQKYFFKGIKEEGGSNESDLHSDHEEKEGGAAAEPEDDESQPDYFEDIEEQRGSIKRDQRSDNAKQEDSVEAEPDDSKSQSDHLQSIEEEQDLIENDQRSEPRDQENGAEAGSQNEENQLNYFEGIEEEQGLIRNDWHSKPVDQEDGPEAEPQSDEGLEDYLKDIEEEGSPRERHGPECSSRQADAETGSQTVAGQAEDHEDIKEGGMIENDQYPEADSADAALPSHAGGAHTPIHEARNEKSAAEEQIKNLPDPEKSELKPQPAFDTDFDANAEHGNPGRVDQSNAAYEDPPLKTIGGYIPAPRVHDEADAADEPKESSADSETNNSIAQPTPNFNFDFNFNARRHDLAADALPPLKTDEGQMQDPVARHTASAASEQTDPAPQSKIEFGTPSTHQFDFGLGSQHERRFPGELGRIDGQGSGEEEAPIEDEEMVDEMARILADELERLDAEECDGVVEER